MSPLPGSRLVEKVRAAHARHLARHRPTGFDLATADRVAYLHHADWDAVTAEASVFTSRRYLAALDAASPENVRPRYALAYRGGAPVAAVAMQSVRIPADGLRAHDASWRRRLGAEVLVCGNLLAWGRHGVTFAPAVAAADAWPAVAEALYRVRRAHKLEGQTDFVLVKDLTEADAGGVSSLETFGYRPFETEPDMVLELPEGCGTLDDYLALFRGKYRKSARAVLQEAERAGYRVELVADVAAAAETLHRLYLQVHAGAPVRLFTLSPSYLPAVAAALGDGFRCVALVREGRTDGFVTVVRDGSTAVAYYMGYDRAANAAAPVYFRLLYAAVEAALAMGCRRVSFGRTALEPKARLGARPVPLRCWVRHRLPVVNLAIRRWLREVPHDDAPDRSPFREA